MKALSENRGYANVLSGAMHLLDLPGPVLFKYFLDNRLPLQFLPAFLHETTHFWCMASNLGSALALIEMRTQREFNSVPSKERIYRGVMLGDVTHAVLAPLLEGFALFVEFDTYPGCSDISCQPVDWAIRLFRPSALSQSEQEQSRTDPRAFLDRFTKDLLDGYRTGDQALSRKITVLMQPLRKDPELYLSGYLTLKQLWTVARQRTAAFADRDLFIAFLHNWVFEDWVLIGYLLNEQFSIQQIISLFSGRLQERLHAISHHDLSKEAALLNSELSSSSPDSTVLSQAAQLSPQEVLEPKQRLDELLFEMIDLANNESDSSLWAQTDLLTYTHRRSLLRLSHEPIEIEVNEHRRTLVRKTAHQGLISDIYLSGPAPDHAELGITPGWLVSYYVPGFNSIVTFALRESYSALTVSPKNIPEDDLKLISVLVTKIQVTENPRRAARAACRQIVLDYWRTASTELRQSVRKHAEDVYCSQSFRTAATGANLMALEESLSRSGLYDLFHRDGDLMTAVAKLSLISELNSHTLFNFNEVLRDLDMELVEMLEKVATIQSNCDWSILTKGLDGQLLCTV